MLKNRIQFWLLVSLLLFKPLVSEAKSDNPLYKALPNLEPTLEALLDIEPQKAGFVPIPFRESLEANWVPTEDNFFDDVGIQLAEKKFEQFCQELSNPASAPSIPRIIHLIWIGSDPSARVHFAVESWKKHHPNWEVLLWTDRDMETFSWTTPHSENVFNQGKNWAEKSDILRLELLYQFGGIYSDTDVICFKSFEDLITRGITLFAGLESNKIKRFGRPLLGSALIGAEKNSPAIRRCMDYTLSAEEAPTIHQHLRSGPGPVTTACYEAIEANEGNVLILPCSYFYPLPWEKRLVSLTELMENIRPESFAIHLWEGTWFEFYLPPQNPTYKAPAAP